MNDFVDGEFAIGCISFMGAVFHFMNERFCGWKICYWLHLFYGCGVSLDE